MKLGVNQIVLKGPSYSYIGNERSGEKCRWTAKMSFSLIVDFSASLPPCFHLPYVSDIIPGLDCIFLSLENSLLDRLQLGGQRWPSLSISLGIRSNLSPMYFFAVYLESLKCKSLQSAARETRFSRASDWPPQPVPGPEQAGLYGLLPKIKGPLFT